MEKVTKVADIVWENPPASNRQTMLPPEVVAELKHHAGTWARVATKATTTAAAGPWKKQGFETRAARTNPGEKKCFYSIYVRWPAKPPTATQAAIKTGTAITPKPGGYIANREARGVPAEGKPLGALNHHPIT